MIKKVKLKGLNRKLIMNGKSALIVMAFGK